MIRLSRPCRGNSTLQLWILGTRSLQETLIDQADSDQQLVFSAGTVHRLDQW